MDVRCPGPLLWFEVGDAAESALLECAAEGCGYVAVAGMVGDELHCGAPVTLS